MSNKLETVVGKPTTHIEDNITNNLLPSGFDTLVCVDTGIDGNNTDLYIIGLCSNVTMSSQRPISQIPELGSNFTFLLTDSAQNTLSLSRIMPVKKNLGNVYNIGCLSYEIYNNYFNTSGYSDQIDLIMPDLDAPIYDHPFQLYIVLLKEDTSGTRTISSKIKLDDCMFAQYNIGEIVAGRKSIPETAVMVFGTQDEIVISTE